MGEIGKFNQISKSDFIKAGIKNRMKSNKKRLVARFESFESNKNWLVYYSGGNGMGEYYEKFEGTEKEASDYCYTQACDSYDSFAVIHGIRDIDEIMEEDEVDYVDAEQIYNDDRESSIDYRYEVYDPVKHSDLIRESVESLSKNPKVKTTLVGVDGNAYSLMGHFSSEARKQGWNREDINEVTSMAMEGDYNHLIRTLMTYIDDTHDGEDECEYCHGDGCENCGHCSYCNDNGCRHCEDY